MKKKSINSSTIQCEHNISTANVIIKRGRKLNVCSLIDVAA
ncbi:flagellar biosynthesis protein fliQ [Candidatus Photodesmus katoptron]|nr:flagellar biosynthesis protein fliQ [Candidatus Photodesmus katoptron]